ncbi:unnamed protein product, partial [Amoebophrya sp. A25]
ETEEAKQGLKEQKEAGTGIFAVSSSSTSSTLENYKEENKNDNIVDEHEDEQNSSQSQRFRREKQKVNFILQRAFSQLSPEEQVGQIQ